MRSLRAVLGLAVLAFILAGCGGGSGSAAAGTSPSTGTARLSWTAPTTNTNGTALTDLAGYYINYGTSRGSMTNQIQVTNPATVSYTVTNLSQGTWYFTVTAYTTTGLQSGPSDVGSKTIT